MTPTRELPVAQPDRDAVVDDAIRVAQAAAARSGVEIHEIEQLHELDDVRSLLSVIWNRDAIATDLLMALSKSGNYVAGAFLDGRLVGAAFAFASPSMVSMHSHITGIDGRTPVRGAGYALKLHQRAWALRRGVSTVTWTFDPLVRRNAHFNINKLGVRVVEYLPNFYGEMKDRINAGEQSDRLLVAWELLAPDVVSACEGGRVAASRPEKPTVEALLRVGADGEPRRGRGSGPRAVIAVPPDVERMRVQAPALAHEWRLTVRDALGLAMAGGARVVGFHQTEGYVVEMGAEPR